MRGGNLYDLQKILGHSSIKMTERYAHLDKKHLQAATEYMSLDLGVQMTIPPFSHQENKLLE